MRLSLSQQYIENLSHIGLDLKTILELANLPDSTWKEEMNLSTLDYYHLLTAFDQVANDEQIIAMSRIKDIQMFMPPFFAALSSKNGLAAIEHFAKYKKITGPIVVNMEVFDDLVRVSYRYDYSGLDLPRFAVLNEQLLLVDLIRTGTGKEIVPVHVGSPYTYEDASIGIFGCPVEVMEGNERVFKKSDLEKHFLTANNVMLDYLEPQLKERLAEAMTSESFTGIV